MPFMHGSYLKQPQLATVVIEICTDCGQPAIDDLLANKE